MRISGRAHFSPKYKFSDLDWANPQILIDAFADRVESFYIRPAEKLNAEQNGFAAGVLCLVTIDFLARVSLGVQQIAGVDYVKWVRNNIREFDSPTLAIRVYREFRCGLVHEGRIKKAGQFSYEFTHLVAVDEGLMLVNPDLLLKAVETTFRAYLEKLKTDRHTLATFRKSLLSDFRRDVKMASH